MWRNVMPHLASRGRCIAPDLVGFGKSAKPDINYDYADHPDINYDYADHYGYIEGFIEALGLKDIILVLHD